MKNTFLKTTITTFLLIFLASTVFATCYYNGKEYPTGARVGSKVCGYDGYWK